MKNFSGLLLVDKPKSWTSFDVIRTAKKQLGIRKIGHSGTLDPFATGLLVLAVNEATKALQYLIKSDKKYIAEFELGKTSDTHDTEGVIKKNIIEHPPVRSDIETILKCYHGQISQIPPEYSAVKIQGKRACDRVRNGETVIIKPKIVEIFSIEILEYEFPFLKLLIHCGSGFYVRSLARDLGNELKTGAICSELKRIEIGNFKLSVAIKPEEISNEKLITLKSDFFDMPAIELSDNEFDNLKMGRKVELRVEVNEKQTVVIAKDKKIVGFGETENNWIQPKRLLFN